MKIHIPNSAFLGNIDPFLRSFDNTDTEKLEITTHKKWISIHPMVLAMVAAAGLGVPPSKISFEKLEAKSKHYLERMGLFKLLSISSGIQITEHEPAGRFIPLLQITSQDMLTHFISEMVPLLHLERNQSETIKYIISELVRNVFEHSCSQNGAIVCAQYYKKSNTIRLGIADTGVGIKETINISHAANTDIEAIKLALTPGITGTTAREGGTEQNAGAGLFFIKSIAKAGKDFFVIYSGKAMYKLLKASPSTKRVTLYADPFKDRHSTDEDLPFWKGTIAGIDISLEGGKDFSILLDMIRNTYIKAIQERKKKRYKKARFI